MTRSIFHRYPSWRWALAATSAAAMLLIGSTAFASTGGSSGSSSDTWTTTVQVVSGVSGGIPTPMSGATGLTADATDDNSNGTYYFAHGIGLTVSAPSTVSSAGYSVEASQTLLSQGGSGLANATVYLYVEYANSTLAGATGRTEGAVGLQTPSGAGHIALTSSFENVLGYILSCPGTAASTYKLAVVNTDPLTAGTYSGAITFQTAITSSS